MTTALIHTVRPGATGILTHTTRRDTRSGPVRINSVEPHPRIPGALYVGWDNAGEFGSATSLGAWGYTYLMPDGSNPLTTGFGSTFKPA